MQGKITGGNLAGILGGLVALEAGDHLPEFWGIREHSLKVEPAVAVSLEHFFINLYWELFRDHSMEM